MRRALPLLRSALPGALARSARGLPASTAQRQISAASFSPSIDQQSLSSRSRVLFAEDIVDQHMEFRVQILIAHRPLAAADRVLDMFLQHAAILQRDLHVAFVVAQRNRRSCTRRDRAARSPWDLAPWRRCIPSRPPRRTAARPRQEWNTLNLPSRPTCGVRLPVSSSTRCGHGQMHLLDFRAGELVLLLELHAAVDRGMNDDAAGERLVGIEC